MFSSLRDRFGIPGVIAVIALVFAMLGGAYAANNSGGGKATASAKGKPGPRGKTGKTGPAGPAGPAGPQGPAGANGKDGGNGAAGAAGTAGAKGSTGATGAAGGAGAAGKSVEAFPIATGATGCAGQGGAEYEVQGSGTSTEVCNGKVGSPWAPNNVLPAGATLTGAWYVKGNEETVYTPLSFFLPLAANVKDGHFFFGTGEEEDVEVSPGVFEPTEFRKHCPALTYKTPTVANAGELCVYMNESETVNAAFAGVLQMSTSPLLKGAAKPGGLLAMAMTGAGQAMGTWAVKGCSTTPPVGDPLKCP